MSEPELASPCIGVCALDEQDICTGCFRSADEVTDWFFASPERKSEILRNAVERHRTAAVEQAGG